MSHAADEPGESEELTAVSVAEELAELTAIPDYLLTPAARGFLEDRETQGEAPDYELDSVYFRNGFDLDRVMSERTSRLAVIVHFYYAPGWLSIVEYLKRLDSVPYDLVVTVPENRRTRAGVIPRTRPDAIVAEVPNHGKDCYPFIRVAKVLHEAGYTKVLKLQTKKVTGDAHDAQWQITALDQLIPQDPEVLAQVVSALDNKKVGMIGPARYYTPLDGAIAQVVDLLKVRLSQMYDHATAEFVYQRRDLYGFFAGTMFWLRLNDLGPNIDVRYDAFPIERGQKDGTLAHALERLFCLVPQIEQHRLLELTATELRHRPYAFEGDVTPITG